MLNTSSLTLMRVTTLPLPTYLIKTASTGYEMEHDLDSGAGKMR